MRYPYFTGREENYNLPKEPDPPKENYPVSFSPELSLILSIALKDKPDNENIISMLKQIEPSLSGKDREAVAKLLHYSEFEKSQPRKTRYNGSTDLLGVLRSLTGFSGSSETGYMFEQMKNIFLAQEQFTNFSQKLDRFQNKQNMNMSDMMDTLTMFMPKDQLGALGNISNMSNMMNLFGNMKNLDPSMLMQMMGK